MFMVLCLCDVFFVGCGGALVCSWGWMLGVFFGLGCCFCVWLWSVGWLVVGVVFFLVGGCMAGVYSVVEVVSFDFFFDCFVGLYSSLCIFDVVVGVGVDLFFWFGWVPWFFGVF